MDTLTAMTQVVRPDARYHRSYLEAAAEFGDARRDGDGDLSMAPDPSTGFAGFDFTGGVLDDPATFAELVRVRRAEEIAETPRPAGRVSCTHLWVVDGDAYVGSVALRHELTDFLLREGGHIGYSTRPSARRRGHASAAVREVLRVAHERGMGRVLITCAEDNLGSRAIIEGVGGAYEDSQVGTRRYWVETSPFATG